MSEEKEIKKGKPSLLLISAIIILLITLGTVGGLGYYIMTKDDAKEKENPEKVEIKVEDIVAQSFQTETITTSLYSGNFVVIQLNALLDSEESKHEFEAKQAQVKSIVISYLSEKNLEDLKGKENIDKVLADLKKEINSELHEGKIVDLFIVDYKLQ